jgi:hypothetical protein
MRNAASIINAACTRAHVPRYTAIALDELNSLLRHIELTADLSAARGQWNFTFNPQLISSGQGNIITAAPNLMPIDYLRVAGSTGSSGQQRTSKWYFQGVPYDMVEIDLTEWDDQVQQAGISSYPYFWAKDFATFAPAIEAVGNLVSSSQNVTATILDSGTQLSSILPGMGIAGGIGPLSVIPPGTTVTGVTLNGNPPTSATLALSAAPTASLTAATLLIGRQATGYPYPPPSGAYAVMIRYQRMMPRLTVQQVGMGAYPWFSDDETLVEGLTGLMCQYADDSRTAEFIGRGLGDQDGGRFGRRMGQYLRMADDRQNRANTVQLDRRVWGKAFSALPNSKQVGW